MLGNGSGKLGALRAVGGGLETGPKSWERGCEGWRHPWLMLPLHSRILTIPVPPIPIPLTFAFPCTPPKSGWLWMFIRGGEVQEGWSGLPPSLGTVFDLWCPCPAPHHLLRAPHSQAGICLRMGKMG